MDCADLQVRLSREKREYVCGVSPSFTFRTDVKLVQMPAKQPQSQHLGLDLDVISVRPRGDCRRSRRKYRR